MFHINEYDQDSITDAAGSIDDISRAAHCKGTFLCTARVYVSTDKASCLVTLTERMIMYSYN